MIVRLVLGLVLAISLGAGVWLRSSHPREAFCGNNDELSEMMPGLRVHALPLTNLGADIRSNFFASLFYSPHGLGDAGYYFAASEVMSWLRVPITDTNLWNATSILCLVLALLAAALAASAARNRPMAVLAASFIALSPLYLFASHTAFGRVVATACLQLSAFVLAYYALRKPGWVSWSALAVVMLILALGDGFFAGPVVLIFMIAHLEGNWLQRLRAAGRLPAFRWALVALLCGLAIDVALAVLAARQQAPVTLFGYLRIRASSSGAVGVGDLLAIMVDAMRKYFPVAGAAAVVPAWLLAVKRMRDEPLAAALAAWLFIACVGVLRYYASGAGVPSVGALTAYPIALPSYLVVAWALGRLLVSPNAVTRTLSLLAAVLVVSPMFWLAIHPPIDRDYRTSLDLYTAGRDRCLVVKAASVLVRAQGDARATVFHLADEVSLGIVGEYYYGLSYVGNHRTGERNQIVDFGTHMVGRRYTPESLAQAYGVPHFTYYVHFATNADPFAEDALRRLAAAGAQSVLTITDGDRLIGSVWAFSGAAARTIDTSDIANEWARHGQLRSLFLQPLAGTAYHFGASWAVPRE